MIKTLALSLWQLVVLLILTAVVGVTTGVFVKVIVESFQLGTSVL
jgi:hypothetical protein